MESSLKINGLLIGNTSDKVDMIWEKSITNSIVLRKDKFY